MENNKPVNNCEEYLKGIKLPTNEKDSPTKTLGKDGCTKQPSKDIKYGEK